MSAKSMSFLTPLKFIFTHPLSKDNKLASLARFAKWQIGSRLVPGAVIYDWINDSKFIASPGEIGLTGSIYAGLHSMNFLIWLFYFTFCVKMICLLM